MELPQELLILIKEFSKPITRPDWRRGCALERICVYSLRLEILHQIQEKLNHIHIIYTYDHITILN